MTASKQYPEGTGPNDPSAPWNQTGEPVQDADFIEITIDELDNLEVSLIYLDRRIFPNSHFTDEVDIYAALQKTRKKLQEMLTVTTP